MTLIVFGLSGCEEKKTEEKETFRTVSFFDKNKDVREEQILNCKEMHSMTNIIEKDCNNAQISLSNEEHEKSRSVSVDWLSAPRPNQQK